MLEVLHALFAKMQRVAMKAVQIAYMGASTREAGGVRWQAPEGL